MNGADVKIQLSCLWKFKEFSALNSTFSTPYNKNETRQIKEIKKYLKNWDGNGKI